MLLFDQQLMPFTYSLAAHFPIGQRYFSSVLAQTYPNRRFLFAGTASGLTATNLAQSWSLPAANGTIFDRLTQYGIDWNSYTPAPVLTNATIGIIKSEVTPANIARVKSPAQFKADCAAGALPPFSLLDPNYKYSSEENPQDIQLGDEFVASVVNALMNRRCGAASRCSSTTTKAAATTTTCRPRRRSSPTTSPRSRSGRAAAGAGRLRPLRLSGAAVRRSPYAHANYVSNIIQDHTSVTAFIERKWNLPAMTFRDAHAHPMTDYFDFSEPASPHRRRSRRRRGSGQGCRRARRRGSTRHCPRAPFRRPEPWPPGVKPGLVQLAGCTTAI